MKVTKKDTNIAFNISGSYSEKWFSNDKINVWEQETFKIIEKYSNKDNGVYVDIGAWIGPTSIYSSFFYNKVVSIEPDPIAYNRLLENLSVNNITNITTINKALSDSDGFVSIGTNGNFGDSETSMLVSDEKFVNEQWGNREWSNKDENITVETLTLESILKNHNIDAENISLMKMDVEGGELVLVPYLKKFLEEYKPNFHISVHHSWLSVEQIKDILDILLSIYGDTGYLYQKDGSIKKINKDYITDERIKNKEIESVVFSII